MTRGDVVSAVVAESEEVTVISVAVVVGPLKLPTSVEKVIMTKMKR